MKKVRIAGYAGALLLLCGLALLLWKWPDLKARAEAGAAYGARIACSCRYVENRSMESCEGDMEPGMDMVSLDDDTPNRAVTGNGRSEEHTSELKSLMRRSYAGLRCKTKQK